jgi:dGTP triphosphohydrolase
VLFEDGGRLLPDERQKEFAQACIADCASSPGSPHQPGEHSLKDCGGWLAEPRPGTVATNRARVVCDYVAGMTDAFAERMHARLLGDGRDQYITDLL